VAESVLVKHQLLILNHSRRRSPERCQQCLPADQFASLSHRPPAFTVEATMSLTHTGTRLRPSDIFNDFALQHDITGNGFTALYQSFLETQVATLALRFRFSDGGRPLAWARNR
jgi:hypothetical protein